MDGKFCSLAVHRRERGAMKPMQAHTRRARAGSNTAFYRHSCTQGPYTIAGWRTHLCVPLRLHGSLQCRHRTPEKPHLDVPVSVLYASTAAGRRLKTPACAGGAEANVWNTVKVHSSEPSNCVCMLELHIGSCGQRNVALQSIVKDAGYLEETSTSTEMMIDYTAVERGERKDGGRERQAVDNIMPVNRSYRCQHDEVHKCALPDILTIEADRRSPPDELPSDVKMLAV